MHLTIVGGGLAGLVAAVKAADRGLSVRLYEAHATGRCRASGRLRLSRGGRRGLGVTRVVHAGGGVPGWEPVPVGQRHGLDGGQGAWPATGWAGR
jgi:phytoene dehydrogenase-like protein